jgi:hypothetical protein
VEPEVQRRVQFAVLLQFAEHRTANLATTATIVPGAGGRDFLLALQNLLDDGSLQGPPDRVESLVELAGGGWLRLTDRGRQRLHANP